MHLPRLSDPTNLSRQIDVQWRALTTLFGFLLLLKRRFSLIAFAALLAATALPAQSLLTATVSGMTQVTDFGASCVNGNVYGYYCFGAGAREVGTNGFSVTYSASNSQSLIGFDVYHLIDNGDWQGIYYGATNIERSVVRFTFATAVSSIGAIINYAPGFGTPTIRALDASNNVIATFGLIGPASITTTGLNAGAFRGITSTSANISAFEITGSYIATQNLYALGLTTVPEPSTIALMGVGLFSVLVLRRRARRK